MAKIWTEIDMDKPRKMRFGYLVMKEIDLQSKKTDKKQMDEIEALEYMIHKGLKEDDPELKLEDIPNILNECDLSEVKNKLQETIERDMPGLAGQSVEAIKNEESTVEILDPQ